MTATTPNLTAEKQAELERRRGVELHSELRRAGRPRAALDVIFHSVEKQMRILDGNGGPE